MRRLKERRKELKEEASGKAHRTGENCKKRKGKAVEVKTQGKRKREWLEKMSGCRKVLRRRCRGKGNSKRKEKEVYNT